MKIHHHKMARSAAMSRRGLLRGAAGTAALAAAGRPAAARAGAGERRPARADPPDPRGRSRLPHGRRLAAGGRALPRRHARHGGGGRVRGRRADLHGAQQPEPAQLPVPRVPQALGGLHRRADQLDRPCAGRLQRAPAAEHRHRHGGLRHHRDGRALRGGRDGPRPRRPHARLGARAHRDGRLRGLPPAARGHLGRHALPRLGRWRLPQLQLPHRLLRERGLRPDVGRGGPRGPLGAAHHLGARQRDHAVPRGQGGPFHRPARLRLPRPAQGLGGLRLLLPREPRHGLRQAARRPCVPVRPGGHDGRS